MHKISIIHFKINARPQEIHNAEIKQLIEKAKVGISVIRNKTDFFLSEN